MSQLSQLLDRRYKDSGRSVAKLGKEFGWSQQTFYNWLTGASLPRPQYYGRIGDFLNLTIDQVEVLIEEARNSTGNTKIPKLSPTIYGKVVDRKDGKFSFPIEYGQRYPTGRYAFRVDTKVMEPMLVVGGLAFAQPGIWPQPGNEVIVHAKSGAAWIGVFESFDDGVVTLSRPTGKREVRDVEVVHVIVLSERLVGGGTNT